MHSDSIKHNEKIIKSKPKNLVSGMLHVGSSFLPKKWQRVKLFIKCAVDSLDMRRKNSMINTLLAFMDMAHK